MLITHWCYSCCWAVLTLSEGLSSFSCPASKEAGGTRNWEGTQPGQLTLTDQTHIPYRMASCSACKAGGRSLEWWCFVFPRILHVMEPCFPAGSGERISCFALLVCPTFVLPLKQSLSQPVSFLTWLFQFSSPSHQGEWVSGCVRLSCWLRLNHKVRWIQTLLKWTYL